MVSKVRTRAVAALSMPVLLFTLAACDIVTADLKSQASDEWRRSYELQPGGRVEVVNVNGGIEVERSTNGGRVEVVAVKRARGASPEAAREALDRVEIVEEASPEALKLDTKFPRAAGPFQGSAEVHYTLRVPASTSIRFTTVNGGIEIGGVDGSIWARTTNGGIKARGVGGPIEASTTNGGVEVELTRVAEPGVNLSCTNGGIRLRLPPDARANISASVTNGGIETRGVSLDTLESSRRRLEARLNGGGPAVRLSGTNGGIRIGS